MLLSRLEGCRRIDAQNVQGHPGQDFWLGHPTTTMEQEYGPHRRDRLGRGRASEEAGFDRNMVKPMNPQSPMKLLAELPIVQV
jgi:hypothetical protein